MEIVWIIFIWVIAMIIYYTWKWRKEKQEKMIISKKGINDCEKRMKMSIGEILKRKHEVK